MNCDKGHFLPIENCDNKWWTMNIDEFRRISNDFNENQTEM